MENNTLFKKRSLKKNLSPVFEDESKTTKVAKESSWKDSYDETTNLKNDPISFLYETINEKLIESNCFSHLKLNIKLSIHLFNKEPELKRSCEESRPDSPKEQIPPIILNQNIFSESGMYGSVRVYNGEAIKKPFSNGISEFLNELKVYDHLLEKQCKYIVKRLSSCEKQLFLKMEYCESTLHKLIEDQKLDEKMIQLLTFQLVSAVKTLHSPFKNKLVIHRDIKSNNILIKTEDSGELTLKLADFGSSKILEVGKENLCYGDKGVTKIIMAPEIYGYPNGGGYNERVDIWSIGCVVLQMITGKINFWPESEYEDLIVNDRMALKLKAPGYDFNKLSDDLRDFLDLCFKIEQHDRISASELLKHKYLSSFN